MKIIILSLLTSFLVLSNTSWAQRPDYLDVPNWQSCVSVMNKGGARFVCLPNARPYYCPASSWMTLINENLVDRCKRQHYIVY